MGDHQLQHFDVAVVGGGIAGVSAAAAIAQTHSVVLLEQESELAYHTTSRSAAVYVENEGGPIFHRLSTASRPFFDAEHVVEGLPTRYVEAMPVLAVGNESNRQEIIDRSRAGQEVTPSIRIVEGDELLTHCPIIDPASVTIGMLEPTAGSIDVMGVHQHFLRNARRDGVQVLRSAKVQSGERRGGRWHLETAAGTIDAEVVVNAAGAWGDVVASSCGVQPVGLQPKRRTAFTARSSVDPTGWPFIYSSIPGLECYFKAEAGSQLLCSLSDEQDSEPCDARPEELDIALAIERINTISTLDLRSVTTTWAGLRTFASDRNPIFGWDDSADGFLWMVGQGGCGIVTAPAAGEVAGALVRGESLPSSVTDLGLTAEALAPRR